MIVSSLMFAYIVLIKKEFTKKPKLKDYERISSSGIMKNKITGGYYCQPCLIKGKIESELSKIDNNQMFC